MLIDFTISPLVYQLANALQIRLAVGNIGLNDTEHLGSGLCELDENCIVDLEEAEELKNLSWLWGNLVDTFNTNDEGEFRLGGNIEAGVLFGRAGKTNLLPLRISVFLDVGLRTFEDGLPLCF